VHTGKEQADRRSAPPSVVVASVVVATSLERTLTKQFDVADGLGRYDERLGRIVVDGGVHGLFVGDCNINGVLDDDTWCEQHNS